MIQQGKTQLTFAKYLVIALITHGALQTLATGEIIQLLPIADAALFEQSPEANQGANETLPAGSTAKGKRARAVFQFDFREIPPSANIIAAQLTIEVTKVPIGGGTESIFGLHRVLRPWTEGTKTGNIGKKAETGVTWQAATSPGPLWENLGGDYVATASTTQLLDELGKYRFDNSDQLIADIESWLRKPELNAGWILLSSDEATRGTARRIGAREHSTAFPVLEIEYATQQTLPSPLRLEMKHSLQSNAVTMTLAGSESSNYFIESSTDLHTWARLAEIQMPKDSDQIEFQDSSITGVPTRFYRSKELKTQTMAHITSVQATGGSDKHTFSVEIESPDLGCEQYADWWEVLTESGDLLYRRILTHSHVTEQPFSRQGGPVQVNDTTTLIIRAHMNTVGYGGMAFRGTIANGFQPIALDHSFAQNVETEAPLPSGCAF